jgi:hypothetical protein
LKRWSIPKKQQHFGLLFCLSKSFNNFAEINRFKTWFVVGKLTFEMGFNVDVLDFKFSNDVHNLAFWLVTALATYWTNFISYHLVTLAPLMKWP